MGNLADDKHVISFKGASELAVMVMLGYLAISLALRNDPALRSDLSNLILMATNLLATISLFTAAGRLSKGTKARFSWTMLSIAQLMFTLGDIAWAFVDPGTHLTSFPTIADLIYLACYPLFLIGILSMPAGRLSKGARVKALLDACIVVVSALLVFWALVVGPAIAESSSDLGALAILLGHPVLDLLLIFALASLMFRPFCARERKAISLLLLGSIVWIASDLIYILQSVEGTYLSGGISDMGSMATYLLVGLAGVSMANSGKSIRDGSGEARLQIRWAPYAPYAGVAGAFVLLVWSHDNYPHLEFGQMAIGVGILIGLVLVRQALAIDENSRLYRSAKEEIARREAAEESLKESERKYREFIDSLPQMVYEMDLQGKYTFANRSGYSIFGYNRQEFEKGVNVLQTIALQDHKRVLGNIKRILAGETIEGQEYLAVRKDKSTFYVATFSSPIIQDGRAVGIRGVSVDITDRKNVQEELQYAKERLKFLLSSSPAVIYTGSPSSEFQTAFVSDNVVQIIGFLPEDFTGKPGFLKGRIHPDDAPLLQIALSNLIEKGSVVFEYRFLHRDGRYRWMHDECRLIRDTEGRPVEVIGYWADITQRRQAEEEVRNLNDDLEERVLERTFRLEAANRELHEEIQQHKRTEEALQKSEERFRRLAENAPDVIFRVDLSPKPHLSYISPAITHISGYSPEDFYNDPSLEFALIHPEDRGMFDALQWGSLPNVPSIVLRWLKKDGTICWAEHRWAPVCDQSGNLVGIEGVARDITEQMKAEEDLRLALREKEVMLKEIHHRVKNNLQVISSLLRLQSGQVRDAASLEALRESQNRVRSLSLIHERLYQSQSMASIKFSDYARRLATGLISSYKVGNVISLRVVAEDISLGIDKAIPCGLIINELISNSLKHAFPNGKGGKIWIALSRSGAGELSLIVGDDGIGIPEDLDFIKAQTLGLRLVKGLVEQLHGSIELNCDQGTEFKIDFPED
jgi:PAS domain S-box-containing protein